MDNIASFSQYSIEELARSKGLTNIDVIGGYFAINKDDCLFVFDFKRQDFVEVYEIKVVKLVSNKMEDDFSDCLKPTFDKDWE